MSYTDYIFGKPVTWHETLPKLIYEYGVLPLVFSFGKVKTALTQPPSGFSTADGVARYQNIYPYSTFNPQSLPLSIAGTPSVIPLAGLASFNQ